MDQRRIELRIIYLERMIAMFEAKKAQARDVAEIRRLEDEILGYQHRISEMRQWGKEIDLDPGYGKLIRCTDGMLRPKLPVFKDKHERAAALDNRAGTIAGLSEADVRRAREFRAKEDAEISIANMDGRSPYVPEDERKSPRGTI